MLHFVCPSFVKLHAETMPGRDLVSVGTSVPSDVTEKYQWRQGSVMVAPVGPDARV